MRSLSTAIIVNAVITDDVTRSVGCGFSRTISAAVANPQSPGKRGGGPRRAAPWPGRFTERRPEVLIPFATIVAFVVGLPAAIIEAPRADPVKREKLHVTAKEEHAKTLAMRADFKARRHQLAMERNAKEAVQAAEPPPVPMMGGGGLSTSTSLTVPVVVSVGMPTGGPGAGPSPTVGIPATAGQLPIGYLVTYAPMIRRMFTDAGL